MYQHQGGSRKKSKTKTKKNDSKKMERKNSKGILDNQNKEKSVHKINFPLLKKILKLKSPSNFEHQVFDFLDDFFQKLESTRKDKTYSLKYNRVPSGHYVIRIRPQKEENFHLLLDVHCDEISSRVLNIDDYGCLKVSGGFASSFDPNYLIGRKVEILSSKTNEPVSGIFMVKPSHLNNLDDCGLEEADKWTNLVLDIGLTSKEEAEKLVGIGDPVIFRRDYEEVGNQIVSPALDNHLSIYLICNLLSDKDFEPNSNLTIIFSGREEIMVVDHLDLLQNNHRPDVVMVIDTDIDTEHSDIYNHNKYFPVELGKGITFPRGYQNNQKLWKFLVDLSAKKKIDNQIPFNDHIGGTNLDGYLKNNIIGQFVGIPLRNMHTDVEKVSTDDISTGQYFLKTITTESNLWNGLKF